MTETDRSTPGTPRRRPWLIVVLAALAAVLLAGIITLIVIISSGGGAGAPSSSPTPTELATITPTVTPTPTGVPAPPDDESGPSPEQQLHFKEVLESGDTAVLDQDLADPVELILAASECCGSISRAEAITELGYVGPGSGATWNFSPDDATLASLRGGDYADFFPLNAVVGISSDGFLLSFVPGSDGLISRILINVFP